ncbi:MAG: class I SAM-dependent methyltransferase, partial [Candidatus Limnocylindrales bacterium]
MSALIERYDRLAKGYRRWWAPVLAPTALRVLDRLERLDAGLRDGEPRNVLDLGSGTGTLALTAVQRWPGARVTAFDASGWMLALARREAAGLSAAARLRLDFVQGDAAALAFPAASFNAAVSSFVVQLVPDRAAVLHELARVLRPGGRLSLVGWLLDDAPFDPEDALEDALDDANVERPEEQEDRSGDFRSL